MSERELWQEVLLRQIADARLDASYWPVPASAHDETAEARRYLTRPSKDLAHVCALAGVDMEALVYRMRKRVASVPPLEPARVKHPRVRDLVIEHDGRSLSVDQWEKITGIPARIIRERLRRDWTTADALTVPVGGMRCIMQPAKPAKPPKPQSPPKPVQAKEPAKPPRLTPTISYQGETLTYRQWGERTGIAWFTIRERVGKGWPVEEVLRPGDLRGAHMRAQVDLS